MPEPSLLDQTGTTIEVEPQTDKLPAVRHDPPTTGLMALPVADIERVLGEFKARRKAIRDWIREQLIEGVHYGFPPGCEPREQWQGEEKGYVVEGKWTPASQWTPKPSLYKAGADFIVEMTMLRPEFTADREMWEQFGSKAGTVAVRCRLINEGSPFFPGRGRGEVVGEGVGAAEVGKKRRDANAAAKVAQKSAKVDAVLNAFGLSDLFTQDVEDGAVPKPTPPKAEDAPQTPPRADRQRPVKMVDAIRGVSAAFQRQYPEEAQSKSAFAQWARSVTNAPADADLTKVGPWTPEMIDQCWEALRREGGDE